MIRVSIIALLTLSSIHESQSASHPDEIVERNPHRVTKSKVLILDVDNCLYSEDEVKSSSGMGIEQQIIDNTYKFGERELNLTREECDAMYQSHGSTVEGIRHKMISEGCDEEDIYRVLHDYYNQIYDGIDMTCLIPLSESSKSNTGYNHAMSRKRRHVIRDMLRNLPLPIYFASNSPKQHVMKVLSALGLNAVNYEGLLTPDTVVGGDMDYPTKFHPKEFFRSLLERYESDELVLVDDSTNNLRKARDINIQGLKVNDGSMNLEEALSIAAGHVRMKSKMSTSGTAASGVDEPYEFSDVKYLQSKNVVDMKAIDPTVWKRVSNELVSIIGNKAPVFRIVDVGAGLLSMLELVLVGGGGKETLLVHMQKGSKLEYIAYESNRNLMDSSRKKLDAMGFEDKGEGNSKDEFIFEKKATNDGDVAVKVILRLKDFAEDRLEKNEFPHLIIGCCFADLYDPNELVSSLLRFIGYYGYGGGIDDSSTDDSLPDDILLYFPITFAGLTQFVPPKPFSWSSSSTSSGETTTKIIPSDTLAFQLYADSLIQQHGHNLDPDKISMAMKDIGASLLQSASSIWHIDPSGNRYLWNTMLYFFGTSAAPEIMKRNWDSLGWINRARQSRPIIRVTNQDLLFSLPAKCLSGDDFATSNKVTGEAMSTKVVEEIEFKAPNYVGKKSIERNNEMLLGPDQVEVKSICSLISSGTELKIFKGLFDEAALDVNIKGMADESMKYPLSYGYSLVGVVTRCGEKVVDADALVGKMVFTFSPHASHVIADRDSIQIIPDNVPAEDAIFMPSVETALSIVHDAHVRIGEKVAVYGQGLIGLLVTAILSNQQIPSFSTGQFGTVTVFDMFSDRLAMASVMGAKQALMPPDASAAGPFDVSIEVSGNYRALQSAIDHTRNGGRIIVGSWYGNSNIDLKLGIEFHRSHKTIKTSQVSMVPAELSTLWSKDRRFALAWELVRCLRPSRLITKRVTLNEAQEAYELLDKGKEIAVSFIYNST